MLLLLPFLVLDHTPFCIIRLVCHTLIRGNLYSHLKVEVWKGSCSGWNFLSNAVSGLSWDHSLVEDYLWHCLGNWVSPWGLAESAHCTTAINVSQSCQSHPQVHQPRTELLFHESQCGFQQGQSCSKQLFFRAGVDSVDYSAISSLFLRCAFRQLPSQLHYWPCSHGQPLPSWTLIDEACTPPEVENLA